MTIWFLLWLLLSAFLIYFLGRTLYILFRQKQAWKTYAQKKQLRYRAANFFTSPEMTGVVDGYTLHLFTGEHMTRDARGTRKLTAIEINLTSRLPVELVVATGGMVDVAQEIGFKEEYRPEHPSWSEEYIATSGSIGALKAYLTPERIEALAPLMKVKNAWVILVFKGDLAFVRFDTPSALEDAKKIDMLITRMIKTASVLELKAGEEALLKSEAAKTIREKSATIAVSPEKSLHLELEEEKQDMGIVPPGEESQEPQPE